jgi:hypothetical protein
VDVDRVKHLEFIQAVISRMAANSFLLKGWTVTLAAALLAVSAKEAEARFSLVGFFPALGFWWLDAYYLRQERLFRTLFDHVRKATDEALSKDPYSLSTKPFRRVCPGWFKTLWTGTLFLHLLVLFALAVASVWIRLARPAGILE